LSIDDYFHYERVDKRMLPECEDIYARMQQGHKPEKGLSLQFVIIVNNELKI